MGQKALKLEPQTDEVSHNGAGKGLTLRIGDLSDVSSKHSPVHDLQHRLVSEWNNSSEPKVERDPIAFFIGLGLMLATSAAAWLMVVKLVAS